MSGFTHFDAQGNAIMVDVTDKDITERCATASGCIRVSREVFDAVKDGAAKKGDVLGTARIAGIMAAKRTWELIPLCHPLMLTKVTIDFVMEEETCTIRCCCTAKLSGRTGVEMEALTGVYVQGNGPRHGNGRDPSGGKDGWQERTFSKNRIL